MASVLCRHERQVGIAAEGGMIEDLGVALDNRGNVATNASFMSSVPGVFAAGDTRRGQSLVVWAIAEGRQAAHGIDDHT